MRTRESKDLRCSYVVLVERATAADADDLRDFAAYLSSLRTADCEVVILDASPRAQLEVNCRVLRWVGRYIALGKDYRGIGGEVDLIRAAAAFATCEKLIVAGEDVRYEVDAIEQMCRLLDLHEVVEPQDYVEPTHWWGSVEGARILLHRGVEPRPDLAATFGLRRSAMATLRLDTALPDENQSRRLTAAGADVFAAPTIFVRREPHLLRDWLAERPRAAARDFDVPMKTMFFISLIPFLGLLALLGGARLAAGYAGVVAFASVALALRGRIGAASVFPLRTLLFAPLWVLERSVSVYWALYRNVRGSAAATTEEEIAESSRRRNVASGR
jgi:hypothetical protein